VFPWADTEAIDLLNKLLCYDPALRPTAKQVCPIKKFKKEKEIYKPLCARK
jgi:hypothetical protein